MARFTFDTTDEEDAAILAVTARAAWEARGPARAAETVEQFLERHVRHQVANAIAQAEGARLAVATQAYAAATPEDRAAVEAILQKYVPPKKLTLEEALVLSAAEAAATEKQ